jgi:CheY-like chemotaxis protein
MPGLPFEPDEGPTDVQPLLAIAGVEPEDVRADRYVVHAELGRGALGIVYDAVDTLLERRVALKEFPRLSERRRGDVGTEARALAAIDHPNVVTLYAFHGEASPPFLVMQRADGRRLDSLLRERRLPLPRALAVLRQIAMGLDAIHAAALVHGDVKPANVLVDDAGGVKVVDVGLVPLLQRMSPGDVLGTAPYMSPERALAVVAPPEWATRSDVYSFGVVCFEVLTGRRPFQGADERALLQAHARLAPPRASEVAGISTAFDAPLERALAKSPRHRQETCTALVDELDAAARGADVLGRSLSVLVADDETDCASFAHAALRAGLPGVSVETFATGEAVLASVRERIPAVVVLDLAMPGLCGAELIAAVRSAAPNVGIVVTTGGGSGPERESAWSLGVRSFLVKPFAAAELVHAVTRAARE